VWVETSGQVVFIHSYSVLAASGHNGPKLREGDRQVPEGFYRITSLNPNSSYHLSIKLNYPNAFDQQHADEEGRDHLGGDIFIHGKAASIGCLAMGDPAIEELFVMVEKVGRSNVQVIIAPHDPRQIPLKSNSTHPA
jgi:murein L,D-transpeptidase YafK